MTETKKVRLKNFIRKHIFKKTEISRNSVWLSVQEQWDLLAWDGSSLAKAIDSIFNVIIRLILILATLLVWPIGLIALAEQVLKNIFVETWDNITKKHGVSVVSSSMALVVAGMFWFVLFLIFLPFSLIVSFLRLLSKHKNSDENGKLFLAIISILLLLGLFYSLFLILPEFSFILEYPPLLISIVLVAIMLLGFSFISLKGDKLSSSFVVLCVISIIILIIFTFIIYPNADAIKYWFDINMYHSI